MSFCPFLSNSEKKVECSTDCKLCIVDKDENKCAINDLRDKLSENSEETCYLANMIRNYH